MTDEAKVGDTIKCMFGPQDSDDYMQGIVTDVGLLGPRKAGYVVDVTKIKESGKYEIVAVDQQAMVSFEPAENITIIKRG